MKNRIAIVLTSHAQLGDTGKATGYYLPEASHAYEVFTAAGHEVVFVSPKGGAAPLDPGGQDRHDPANVRFLEDPAIRYLVAHTFRPQELAGGELAAVYFAGGHGTMWDFRGSASLARLAIDCYRHGGVVSAVCHGPSALVDLEIDGRPLIVDQPVTGFSNAEENAVGLAGVVPFLLEDVLRARGGHFEIAEGPWQPHVAVASRLVTGQNPASSRGVAEAVIRQLRNQS